MKALRWILLILVLGLLLVGVAVALFPARVAVEWLGPRLGGLQLEEVSGTIWQGQARKVQARGQSLGTVGWRIHPRSLLARRVDADLTIDGVEFRGAGHVSRRGDTVLLTDARLTMSAQRLQPVLDLPALNLRGAVEFELARAELVSGFPRALEGRATWRDAAVDGAAAAQFGDLIAEFQTGADGALIGTLFDNGGPLALDGAFRLGFTGYEIDAVLSARDGNPQVVEALNYIGQRQPDGSSLLEVRGQLLPLQ